jgi:hypothetical protein
VEAVAALLLAASATGTSDSPRAHEVGRHPWAHPPQPEDEEKRLRADRDGPAVDVDEPLHDLDEGVASGPEQVTGLAGRDEDRAAQHVAAQDEPREEPGQPALQPTWEDGRAFPEGRRAGTAVLA